ncbi:hypothetical protein KSF_101450 [Reticulibacter mediterranei]|uniref:NB-ARC domain-containing protein n=1 Tax=Reticulibacter mediterranei TaxID=2778369 RepID=A0A8J3NA78_9CHLR|nr:NB-ARC domain-containing protein [Reticulibacter mediterranei]GHP00098.1 hypothetical protein KSF_101450 [Reticulibacter mediterranei]
MSVSDSSNHLPDFCITPRDTLMNNLPTPLTHIVGREHEISSIKQHLSTTRLLTLTGAGGIGKTSLAIHVANEIAQTDESLFDGGIWFVELAHLSDAALLPQSIAQALNLCKEQGESLITTLYTFLRSQKTLLILDTCEHLVEASAKLIEVLLQMCPILHILVTSREALGLRGEVVYCLPSLSVPPLSTALSLDDLSSYEATAFFLERVRAIHPHFRVSTRNAPVLAKICRQLEGLPLAIEFAAAWIRAMPVEQIAEQMKGDLDERFSLLSNRNRTAPPRQRTLRTTFDWSYNLLSGHEQTLLQRLAGEGEHTK